MPMAKRNSTPTKSSRLTRSRDAILGDHPVSPHPFGELLIATDAATKNKVPHRVMVEADGSRPAVVVALREMVVQHHAGPEARKRSEQLREAIERLGLGAQLARLRRFPVNPATQKGNLAEIVLAEYVVAASKAALPVYRLRYNPNVDQSMKGDDVLAFDLDADPVRIIVGEAKFRATSSATVVDEIVEALVRSHKAGIPASLQFVADRLFDAGDVVLATRVSDCARLFALGRLRIDYVGMLLSDIQSRSRVDAATPNSLRRLAMISLGVNDPDSLVTDCYSKLE